MTPAQVKVKPRLSLCKGHMLYAPLLYVVLYLFSNALDTCFFFQLGMEMALNVNKFSICKDSKHNLLALVYQEMLA